METEEEWADGRVVVGNGSGREQEERRGQKLWLVCKIKEKC